MATTIKDISRQLGWNVKFDPTTSQVSVTNPVTNKNITFKSGEGQEYGMGGLFNDQNIVSDTVKLRQSLEPTAISAPSKPPAAPIPVIPTFKPPPVPAQATTNTELGTFGSTTGFTGPRAAELNAAWKASGIASPFEFATAHIANNPEWKTYGGTPAPTPIPTVTPAPTPIPTVTPTPFQQGVENTQTQMTQKNEEFNKKVNDLLATISPYEPIYKDKLNQILNQLQGEVTKGFQYAPQTDLSLLQAQKQSQQSTMEEANRRGILASTVTTDRMQKLSQELVPQYEIIAFNRYNQGINDKLQYTSTLRGLESDAYKQYSDYVNTQFNKIDVFDKLKASDINLIKTNLDILFKQEDIRKDEEIAIIKSKEEEYKKAQDRVEIRGYVDNKDAPILGLAVGTPSKEASKATNELIKQTELKKLEILKNYTAEKQKHDNKIKELQQEAAIKAIPEEIKKTQANGLAQAWSLIATLSYEEALKAISDTVTAERLIASMGGENYKKMIEDIIKLKNEAKKVEFEQGIKLDNLSLDKLRVELDRIKTETGVYIAESNVLNKQAVLEETKRSNAVKEAIQMANTAISQQKADTSAYSASISAERSSQTKEKSRTTTADKNKSFGEDYTELKSLSVEDAKAKLTNNKGAFIKEYGIKGYNDLWNEVLKEAIEAGQAQGVGSKSESSLFD